MFQAEDLARKRALERRDVCPPALPDGSVIIMFTDVEDSTDINVPD